MLEAVSGQAGVLTIGAITTAMIDVLPPLIDRFKVEHPQITVAVREIDSAEAIPALESGDIDLAFARLEGNLGKNIRSIPLIEDRLAVAIPRDHPLAAQARIELSSLAYIQSQGVHLAEIPACGHFPMYSNPVVMWERIAELQRLCAAD